MKVEYRFSAGGLVMEGDKVLLIQPEGQERVWTFPKGLVEKGERSPDTALREVEEETGFRCHIIRELPRTSYWFREQGRLVKKTVRWFVMTPMERVSEHDAEIARIAWMPLQQALERLTYASDRELLQAFLTSSASETDVCTRGTPAHARTVSAQQPGAIEEAVAALRAGQLVVFPTDTVYGVGAMALDAQAVEALYRAKGRPLDKAIPILLADAEQVRQVARDIPDITWQLAERFWPGGLTLVLPAAPHLPAVLRAVGETIAVRVPNHPVALALIASLGGPLAATSANRSGDLPALTAAEAEAALGDKVDIILDAGRVPTGVASTVLDLTADPPRVLRPGATAIQELADFLARQGIEVEERT